MTEEKGPSHAHTRDGEGEGVLSGVGFVNEGGKRHCFLIHEENQEQGILEENDVVWRNGIK
jgi:hypothetical protein